MPAVTPSKPRSGRRLLGKLRAGADGEGRPVPGAAGDAKAAGPQAERRKAGGKCGRRPQAAAAPGPSRGVHEVVEEPQLSRPEPPTHGPSRLGERPADWERVSAPRDRDRVLCRDSDAKAEAHSHVVWFSLFYFYE